MSASYAYTPAMWLSLLTAVLLLALASYRWHRRTVPGARVFTVTCLIAVPWMAVAAMEVAALDAADSGGRRAPDVGTGFGAGPQINGSGAGESERSKEADH